MKGTLRKWWRPILVVIVLISVFADMRLGRTPNVPLEYLWDKDAPLALGQTLEDRPRLRVYLPEAGEGGGTGIIVCPDGAEKVKPLAVARWLNGLGITAFVLDYRHRPRYGNAAMVADMERAIRFVRFHGSEYNLSAGHVGVLGFSGGAYLAEVAATDPAPPFLALSDRVDGVSSKPDFVLLGSPVAALPPDTEEAVKKAPPDAKTPEGMDRPLFPLTHLSHDTPPMFIFQAGDDGRSPPQAGLRLYLALKKTGVSAELHMVAREPLTMPSPPDTAHDKGDAPAYPAFAAWTTSAHYWMKGLGLLTTQENP